MFAIDHAATALLVKRRFPSAPMTSLLVSVQANCRYFVRLWRLIPRDFLCFQRWHDFDSHPRLQSSPSSDVGHTTVKLPKS
jgi:hypothetical protein